jgi:hypothetical protein
MRRAVDQVLIDSAEDPRLASWLTNHAPDRAMAIMSLASRWLSQGGRLRIRSNSIGLVVPVSASVIGARLVCPSAPEEDPFLEFLPGRLRRYVPSPDDIEDFVDNLETFGAAANRSNSSWRFPSGTDPARLQMMLDALADLCRRQ